MQIQIVPALSSADTTATSGSDGNRSPSSRSSTSFTALDSRARPSSHGNFWTIEEGDSGDQQLRIVDAPQKLSLSRNSSANAVAESRPSHPAPPPHYHHRRSPVAHLTRIRPLTRENQAGQQTPSIMPQLPETAEPSHQTITRPTLRGAPCSTAGFRSLLDDGMKRRERDRGRHVCVTGSGHAWRSASSHSFVVPSDLLAGHRRGSPTMSQVHRLRWRGDGPGPHARGNTADRATRPAPPRPPGGRFPRHNTTARTRIGLFTVTAVLGVSSLLA